MSIYIANLPDAVTKDDLGEVFSEYGTVKRIGLPVDRKTSQLRGFGFQEMKP